MTNPTTTTGASPATAAATQGGEKKGESEKPALASIPETKPIGERRAEFILRKLVAISIVSEELLRRLRDEAARVVK